MSKNKKSRSRKSRGPGRKPGGCTLSLCLIVRNEAADIKHCLQNFQAVADEMIVVDTGSTDDTPALARSLGARVFSFPWCNDFSAARNASLQQAGCDYILWVDADDRIDSQEMVKLRNLKNRLSKTRDSAYYFIVADQSADQGTIAFLQLRLFPRTPRVRFEGRIHEQVASGLQQAGVSCLRTDIHIRHTGNQDRTRLEAKSRRNLAVLQDAMQDDPENPVWLFHTARTLANLNQREAAVEHMQKLLSRPDIRTSFPRLYFEAAWLQGRYYTELGRPAQAEQIFRGLLKEFPQEGLLHFFLGEACLQSEHYADAVAELELALSIPLQAQFLPLNLMRLSFQRYYYLGLAYQESGKIRQAKEMFIKSLAEHTDQYLGLQALGVLCLKSGDYQEAVRYFEQVIELGCDSDGIYSNLGLAYRKLKQYSLAERAFLKALGINGERIEPLANLGHLYWERQDYGRAANCFSQALRLNPNLTDAALALSELYYRFQDLDNLVKTCETLLRDLRLPASGTLEGYPDIAALYETIGDTLLAQDRRELAEMAYRVALRIFPLPGSLKKYLGASPFPAALAAKLPVVQESLQAHARDDIDLAGIKPVLEQFVAPLSR